MRDAVSRRNARLVIASSFFADLSFVLPIWLIYSINQLGLSSTTATILFTGTWLVSGLFEIPTGAIADRMGRRKAFIIGSLMSLPYPLAFIFGFPIVYFIPVLIVAGVGNALTSGTLSPLVHASFEKAGLGKKAYHKYLSQDRTATFVARALSGATGALLYAVQPWLPFAGWFAATICSVVIGYLLVDNHNQSAKTASDGAHILTTVRSMASNNLIVWALVVYAIINIVAEAIWTGYQLFYEDDGRSPVVIGMLFSAIALISATGAYMIRRAYERAHPLFILFAGSISVLITAILLYQPSIDLRLAAIIPMALASGFMMLTITAIIQHQIHNSMQSTALSVFSVIVYFIYTSGSVLLGWSIDKLGLDQTRQLILIGAIVSTIVVAAITARKPINDRFRLEDKDVSHIEK